MNENLLKHYNHPFYQKVDQITDEVKLMQIRKGAEKYPEPFTPSSWTGKELAIHALQELRDGQVYVVGMLERIEELEERNAFLEKAHRINVNITEHAKEDKEKYKQALWKIVELKYNVYGNEYPEEADKIACEALGVF